MNKGEVEIGLMMNVVKSRAEESLSVSVGVAAALDPAANLGLMEALGASDELIQQAEIKMIKNQSKSRA